MNEQYEFRNIAEEAKNILPYLWPPGNRVIIRVWIVYFFLKLGMKIKNPFFSTYIGSTKNF